MGGSIFLNQVRGTFLNLCALQPISFSLFSFDAFKVQSHHWAVHICNKGIEG